VAWRQQSDESMAFIAVIGKNFSELHSKPGCWNAMQQLSAISNKPQLLNAFTPVLVAQRGSSHHSYDSGIRTEGLALSGESYLLIDKG